MDYWHKNWKCPYFVWDDRKKIACEGGCRVVFHSIASAKKYMESYCADLNGYHRCTIAASLDGYYDEKEGNENRKKER